MFDLFYMFYETHTLGGHGAVEDYLSGMNTGIQDAHNLAWKISSILSGIASPSLMRTYETERRPV